MAYLAQQPQAVRPRPRKRRAAPSPLTAPVLVFAAGTLTAAAYVAFVLWPRWPDAPGALSGKELARGRTLRLGPFPVPPHKNPS